MVVPGRFLASDVLAQLTDVRVSSTIHTVLLLTNPAFAGCEVESMLYAGNSAADSTVSESRQATPALIMTAP